MDSPSRNAFPLFCTLLCAAALPAQVPAGSYVIAWKPAGGALPGGIRLVSPAGAGAGILGLDPATVGRGGLDGARSVLATDDGFLIAGLGVDNRGATTPVPLDLRRILLAGNVAVSDLRLSTLMQVPPGEIWHVSDLKERPDGSLLVAATETLFTANPMPAKAVFLVDRSGAAVLVPTPGIPAGSLEGIADAGDRFVVGLVQSFFVVNVELTSFGYLPSDPPPFRVTQFVNSFTLSGMDLDVGRSLVVGVPFRTTTGSATVVRLAHAPNATPLPVPGTPSSIFVCHVLPAAGLVAAMTGPGASPVPLNLVDTLAGGFVPVGDPMANEPLHIGMRDNPVAYGRASPAPPSWPYLSSAGGLPVPGNPAFAFRAGGTGGSPGLLLAGVARGSVPTPFGTFLLDPARLFFVVTALTLPNAGSLRIPFPIPADPGLRGAVLDLQALLFPSLVPLVGEMSRGLEVSVQ